MSSRVPCWASLFLLLVAAPVDALELAVFQADITPPLNRPACVGFVRAFTSVEHPLQAKGVLLRDGGRVSVLCALDLEGLCNGSYDRFRRAAAEAAGTTEERVAMQSLHQHTAPVYDRDGAAILYRDDPASLSSILDAEQATIDRLAAAIRKAAGEFRPCTHVAATEARVDRVASNRRLEQPDGSIVVRYSAAAKDSALRDAPEGLIDPLVKTVSFLNGDRCLAQLHYYATHPQTRGGEAVTCDVPGLARERLEQETGIFQVYFTGCGGNVAMGKYNDRSPEAREALTGRLLDALRAASRAARDPAKRQAAGSLRWTSVPLRFRPRQDGEFSPEVNQKLVDDSATPFSVRLKSAMLIAWCQQMKQARPVDLTCLQIGSVRIVHLPGEPFVQFQLAAQQVGQNLFVAVAGYGECGPWYLGEDRIYTDRGGFEQTWSFVAPCEHDLKEAIEKCLRQEGS